jgi:hypothetical protein
MIFFGEAALRNAIGQFIAHYHSTIANEIIKGFDHAERAAGEIECREQLGCLLRNYYRKELAAHTKLVIDGVANYRDYNGGGAAVKGKFAVAFEEAVAEFAEDPRYAHLPWLMLPIEQLHNGYFAADKPNNGQQPVWKDICGDTQADDEVYNLIMKDKDRPMQTEYEEDCGVTFGKVPITAIAKLTRVVDGEPQPIGR